MREELGKMGGSLNGKEDIENNTKEEIGRGTGQREAAEKRPFEGLCLRRSEGPE